MTKKKKVELLEGVTLERKLRRTICSQQADAISQLRETLVKVRLEREEAERERADLREDKRCWLIEHERLAGRIKTLERELGFANALSKKGRRVNSNLVHALAGIYDQISISEQARKAR